MRKYVFPTFAIFILTVASASASHHTHGMERRLLLTEGAQSEKNQVNKRMSQVEEPAISPTKIIDTLYGELSPALTTAIEMNIERVQALQTVIEQTTQVIAIKRQRVRSLSK